MEKLFKHVKVALFLCLFATIGSLAYGQSKTGKEASKSSNKNAKASIGGTQTTPPGSTDQAMAVIPEEKEKSKLAGMKFNFVVFVNPDNVQATRQWQIMPDLIQGFTAEPLYQNTYLVTGQGEEYAFFQRAFGNQFQIFTFEDLAMYGQSLPALLELRDLAQQISAKLKK